MNKGIKITLNLVCGASIAVGGYFLGRKHGKHAKEEWARKEINDILDDFSLYRNTHDNVDEVIVSETPVEPDKITPEMLETEFESGDVEPDILEPEEVEQVIIPVKPKKSKRKLPYFVDPDTFGSLNTSGYGLVELSIDRDGDIYDDESDDIYPQVELLGDKNLKSLRSEVTERVGDGEWYIANDNISTYFHIVQK